MAALIDAIDVKRKMYFELENTPYYCLDVEVSTPTARGGQTLVRLKMRNLLTRAVFDKTFKAGEKFKEPDLETVEASYLYSDGDASHFMDQESFDQIELTPEKLGRRGSHPALGPVTLRQLLATWVVHDLNHVHQIAKAMAFQYCGEVGPWREYLSVLPKE